MAKTFLKMNSTLSEHDTTVQLPHYENSLEKLITKLHELKERFESMYYGKAECKKYDKARAFTIELNATLYEANKIQETTLSSITKGPVSNESKAKIYLKRYAKASGTSTKKINAKIEQLDKELNDLIH